LGLAMVYGIAQRHTADLEVESTPGAGTSVRITFPTSDAPDADNPVRTAGPRPRSRLRLLIVDDDPLLLKSLCDILEGDGHLVVAANGGQAGIDAFTRAHDGGEAFDALITDLGMPYVDGRRVSATAKAISPETPVILLTGWGQRLADEGEVPADVDYVLSKPPKLRELREVLAKAKPAE
jgi:CheY-like chemotaxis protein